MNLRILKTGCVIAAFFAIPVYGESPQPFPEVKSKRIGVPKKGSVNRINVQISAEEHALAPVAGRSSPEPEVVADEKPKAAPAHSPKGRYGWFWDKVSPELAKASPGRLDDAMLAIGAGGVDAPRMQTMQDIARTQGIPILRSTVGTSVSPALVLAVIAVESAGKSDAQSHAGAQGLMQLMPATAERFGVTDSLSPDENIAGGVKYLDWLMGEFGQDPIMVLAGYNAGEGAVKKHQGVPPYAETRDYVPKVLAAFQVARGLCSTPPELISDGCVFTAMQ